MSESEQNKTEDPTPFKLRKAREKGQIAKGMDLPFFGSLLGLALFVSLFGPATMAAVAETMSQSLRISVERASEQSAIPIAIAKIYPPALTLILVFAACTVSFIILMQLVQNKGLLFSTHPLKPDFTKLNPAKGLKRIFSLRTLKDAGKNILKMSVYLGATWMMVRYCLNYYGTSLSDARDVTRALVGSGMRLLFLYIGLSFVFALLDQIIVRREFFKQMRMSKSELKREVKDREGEPRIKQKRKQLHQEFAKETSSLGELPGSDLVIVNPQHFAVALRYDAASMTAPIISTKGRNRFALLLKSRATQLGIPILENPPLARTLYRVGTPGQTIPATQFKEVADSYALTLRRTEQRQAAQIHTMATRPDPTEKY